MQCVILAGGLAQRLRPLTETIPKSLVEVGDKPFVHHQLKWLRSVGVTEVLLSIGYLGEMIREYVGDGRKWNLKVGYVDEGKDLRGTAGAVRLALDQGLLHERFLLTYGDSFLPIDFQAVWDSFVGQKLPVLMTIFHNEGKWDTSNVWFDGAKVLLYDKLRSHPESTSNLKYIDYGLSAFTREVIQEMVPPGKSDLAQVLYRLSREGRLAGYEVSTRFYEIGSPSGLEDFRKFQGDNE